MQSNRLDFLRFGRRRSRSASTSRIPEEDEPSQHSRDPRPESQAPSGFSPRENIDAVLATPAPALALHTHFEPDAGDQETRGRRQLHTRSTEVRRAPSSPQISLGSSSRDASVPGLPGKLDLTIIHEPTSRKLDIIFVHGLGGGSRKTWCYNKNPSIFWPEWLPQLSALSRARISTFGYNADIVVHAGTTQANVESFAKQLLHCLTIHGQRHEKFGRVPIIFICHSMGGLVVKRACVKADRDPSMRSLAVNISGIIFLGTPHRGSSQAKKLNSLLFMLGLGGRDKAYIKDLTVNSALLQMLNDDFRHLAFRIKLFSFWEQKKTSIGSFELTIVEQYSAILGYSEEGSAPLYADHHSICKFSSQEDPNYMMVTNTLIGMVDKILENVNTTTPGDGKRHVEEIHRFLLTPDLASTEADFYSVQSKRLEGSCHWVASQPWFTHWEQGGLESNSQVLWLNGLPGTGKSVISTYIIETIKQSGNPCYYYFFRSSDVSKRSLERCLLSIAYQISLEDQSVRDKLRQLNDSHFRLLGAELLLLWQKLFISSILPIYEQKRLPLFLVIDALDEAENAMPIFSLLNTLRHIPTLRLCLTSRPSVEFEQQFSLLVNKVDISSYRITQKDNMADIISLVKTTLSTLPLLGKVRRQIVDKIIQKSEGNILWVALVSKQMLKAGFSEESMMQVLTQVPPGMDQIYADILTKMKAFPPKQKEIARWIISWTLSSFQPLRVSELQEALQFRPPAEHVEALEYWVAELCGSFLVVDREKSVQPIHTTAREFLLADTTTEYVISTATHLHISQVCVELMLKTNHRPSITAFSNNMGPPPIGNGCNYNLWRYAVFWWSDHLVLANSQDEATFNWVMRLLKSPAMLGCIREVAESGDLHPLVRMAKNLKQYINCLDSKDLTARKQDLKFISMWTMDFIRLTTEFGENLIRFPSMTETLIAPFCPTSSAIYERFGTREGGMSLLGDVSTKWDTRLACLTTPTTSHSVAKKVSSSNKLVAVGYQDGHLSVWNTTTALLVHELDLTEPITCLTFNNSGTCIVAGGRTKIKFWTASTASELLVLSVADDLILLAFSPDDHFIFCIFSNNKLTVYNADDGSVVSEFNWAQEELSANVIATSPICVSLNSSRTRMALAYRGLPVSLWDTEEKMYLKKFRLAGCTSANHDHGQRGFPSRPHDSATALEFHTLTNELFIGYSAGTLVKWDTDTNDQVTAGIPADAHIIKCGPDGTIIITGNSGGQIRVWSAATLELLFNVDEDDGAVGGLCFSPDGSRIFDVRRVYCNVWEPEILLRGVKIYRETRAPSPISPGNNYAFTESMSVTCICPSPTGKYFLAGTDSGSVVLYSLTSGKKLKILYSHAYSTEITTISWSKDGQIIATGDNTSEVFVYRLTITNPTAENWPEPASYDEMESDEDRSAVQAFESSLKISVTRLLNGRAKVAGRVGGSITSLLIHDNNDLLIASTLSSDSVWKLNATPIPVTRYSKPLDGCLAMNYEFPRSRQLLRYPNDGELIVIVDSESVRVRTWGSISIKVEQCRDSPDPETNCDELGDNVFSLHTLFNITTPEQENSELEGSCISKIGMTNVLVTCVNVSRVGRVGRHREIRVCNLDQVISQSGDVRYVMLLGTSVKNTKIQSLLGVVGRKLYFLDVRGWICSKDIDLETLVHKETRHTDQLHTFDMWFFLPRGKVTPEMSATLSRAVVWKKDVIFTRKDKVIVVRRGLRGQGRQISS